ncbi:MAG: hypothetical protein IH886_15640 [Nitrospinae bacterium]|nr:hypothetical protein [Nitrospinota bacterium]
MSAYQDSKEFIKDSWGFLKKIKWVNQICLNPSHTQEIESLKKENESLKKEIKDSKLLFFEGDIYWKSGEDGKKEGPFCPGCWDSNQKPIRMVSIPEGGAIHSGWSCTACPFQKIYYYSRPIHVPKLDRF